MSGNLTVLYPSWTIRSKTTAVDAPNFDYPENLVTTDLDMPAKTGAGQIVGQTATFTYSSSLPVSMIGIHDCNLTPGSVLRVQCYLSEVEVYDSDDIELWPTLLFDPDLPNADALNADNWFDSNYSMRIIAGQFFHIFTEVTCDQVKITLSDALQSTKDNFLYVGFVNVGCAMEFTRNALYGTQFGIEPHDVIIKSANGKQSVLVRRYARTLDLPLRQDDKWAKQSLHAMQLEMRQIFPTTWVFITDTDQSSKRYGMHFTMLATHKELNATEIANFNINNLTIRLTECLGTSIQFSASSPTPGGSTSVVTKEALEANGDVGTGSNQVSQGDHGHTHNSLTSMQGGSTNQYFHLTYPQHTRVSGFDQNLATSDDPTFNSLTLSTSPSAASDAVRKDYVDNLIDGLRWKSPVDVATTANITLSGEQTIDDITTSVSRILVKDQTNQTQNGLYTTGSGAWVRTSDANTGIELLKMATNVIAGTANAGKEFVNSNTSTPTVGSDNITFVTKAASVSHNNTSGIQGGTTDEYYHFTNTQHTRLASVSSFAATLLDDANASTALSTLGISTFAKTLIDDTDASTALTTLGFSSFAKTLIDDTDASTALTTLGFSTFAKTLIDDTDAATARGTLGAAGSGANADITSTTALTSITRATGGKLNVATGTASGDGFAVNTSTLVVDAYVSYVGVGIASPTARLHGYVGTNWDKTDYAFLFHNAETANYYGNTFRIIGGGESSGAGSEYSTIFAVGDNAGNIDFSVRGDGKIFAPSLGVVSGIGVEWDSGTGEIGPTTSSIRFKENVADAENEDTAWLHDMRIRKYDRKDGSAFGEIGVIAEELLEVNPDLVCYDGDGEVVGWRNLAVIAPIIKELQKVTLENKALMDRVETLELQMDNLLKKFIS